MKYIQHALPVVAIALAAVVVVSCGRQSTTATKELEVACFKGGYGIDFFEQAERIRAAAPGR